MVECHLISSSWQRDLGDKMSESALKMKYSRFRHVYSKSVRRSEWFDTGPGHGLAVAANPKMIALAIDVPAGGIVQVAKLCSMGRGHMEMGKIKDHEGVVCDLKWNPFNDNVLATASQDATVRIWHIDDILRIRCLRISRAHTRRVHLLEWHTTVDNAIISASLDGRIIFWNIENDEVVYVIEDCHTTSISFSHNCSEFAATTRSRELIVFDARTGKVERSTELPHDGSMPPRVAYYNMGAENEFLITTGNSRNTRRQISMFHSRELSSPLTLIDVDGASGMLMPLIDNDLSLLYVAGKGDANIRFYELSKDIPYINYLNESSGHRAHTTVCALPKRGLSISQCEIMRIFRVDAEQLVIEPLSFIVPRRADCFQADLFPPTRSPTPSLTFREWLAGLDREPILIELRDCVLNCTNKPVSFCKEQKERPAKLITADVNNDRKFRFLSQATRPDYREVTDREDRDEILKLERIRSKLAADSANSDLLMKHEPKSDSLKEDRAVTNDNAPQSAVIVVSVEVEALNHKNSSLFNVDSAATDIFESESLPPDESLAVIESASPMEKLSGSPSAIADRSPAVSVGSGIAFQAPPNRRSTNVLRSANSASMKRDGFREWNEDSASARSCAPEEALVSVIREMEKELCKWRGRCEQLEKLVHVQQQDIDSLRFEIHWKDNRIEFLQSQLSELDIARSTSSHSS